MKNEYHNWEKNINNDANYIATEHKLDDRILKIYKLQAFLMIMDHRENLLNIVKFRLLNSSENDIGIISKTIMERASMYTKEALNINQWRNTAGAGSERIKKDGCKV